MKVAEKDGEKKKQKTRSSRKKEESYVEWIGWGEIKKRKLKKGENKGEEIPLCQKCLSCYAWKSILKVQVS